MRRYIVLLLITGIVWAQTDFDKLVLKDGTTYFGEFSKVEGEIVYFKPQDTFVFEPVSVGIIKNLQLKDGQIIIGPQGVIAWAQTDFDKLILKDGTIFFGEYSKIEEEIVYFKPQDTFVFEPVSVKRIKNLQLKDGRFIIGKYNRELATKSTGVNKLTRNEKVVVGCLLIAVVIIYVYRKGFFLPPTRSGGNCGVACGGNIDVDYP